MILDDPKVFGGNGKCGHTWVGIPRQIGDAERLVGSGADFYQERCWDEETTTNTISMGTKLVFERKVRMRVGVVGASVDLAPRVRLQPFGAWGVACSREPGFDLASIDFYNVEPRIVMTIKLQDSTATPHQGNTPTAAHPNAQLQRGTIPIYRRGYGAVRSRGVTPRPLVWEDGRLRQIEVPEQPSNSLPFPGAVVGLSGIVPPSSLPPPSSSSASPATGGEGAEGSTEFRSPLLRGRGRIGRQRGRGKGLTPLPSSSRSSWQREGGTPAFKMPEFNANLPSPRKRPILPTDPSLPPFSLSAEDPIPPNSVLFPALESDQVNGNASGPLSKKMKSSGVDDLDIETLKTYRRLNGYTLFTLAMKKKYGVSNDDGGQDQKSQNRRWQALWSTLPERDRQQWRVRARRMQKAVEAAPEKNLAAEAKRVNELRRAEAQLVRSETSKYSLLDLAAHFQLLSNVFASAAELMGEYRGPVSMEEVTSSLLDALLTCLIPLTAIASEIESLAGALDKTIVCSGLSSLAHIFPTFELE
ncbi:unnamed protein product [Taenia asiatica]|uniref:HMG box domain-containing protein n=1 Tax=Taenia asiatica TaxID=60517 RepID=A0A0R3W464_TAEAS|nr:unnamed protein product [Taenia asiatica]